MSVSRWISPGLALIATYVVIAILLQTVGFAVSWGVTQLHADIGLITFVGLFVGLLYLAWPISVRVFDRVGLEGRLQASKARRPRAMPALCAPVLSELLEPIAEPLNVVGAVIA
jgi:hypothetical protein